MKLDICLVHGLFGHLRAPEIKNAFGQEAVVSAPDLLGYGALVEADTDGLSLQDQAEHVISQIQSKHDDSVHLVGHSVGGAVAMLVAHSRPELVKSLISVEGNFTLKDAFWSSEIAKKSDYEVEEIVSGYRNDPDAWMNDAISSPTDLSSRLAKEWLNNQPTSTIKAQAAAVVAATGEKSYLEIVRSVMASQIPVHLIAGAKSASGWDTPDWANQLCTSRINLSDAGHLMMVETPKRFAQAVLSCIALSRVLQK